jgi:chemotaxis signal transduction protein
MKRELPSLEMEEVAETFDDRTPDEDDLYEKEAPKEQMLQLVVFRLAREWYGVEITKVKEVIKVGQVTYLP